MSQKTSPFIEAKFGWNLGESGWNSGMDEDLVRFSYLFDSTINGIVSSLPRGTNGDAYYLLSDKRVYYFVDGSYYSTILPKWFEIKLRSTGVRYVFNGTDLTTIRSSVETDSLLNTAAVSQFSTLSWHPQIISEDVNIPKNVNAWSFGPTITIASGKKITVGEGSFWTIANGAASGNGTLNPEIPSPIDFGAL